MKTLEEVKTTLSSKEFTNQVAEQNNISAAMTKKIIRQLKSALKEFIEDEDEEDVLDIFSDFITEDAPDYWEEMFEDEVEDMNFAELGRNIEKILL